MQVRDDEVGVRDLPVERVGASMMPERPPIVNIAMKPSANSIGVSKWMFPRQVVASQLKILIPVGTAMIIDGDHEESLQIAGHADGEHVVGPDAHRVEADRQRGERDRRVAEDRLAREDGDHFGDDADRGQDHDVDLGVAEEPEDVLLEQRRRRPSAGMKKCVPTWRSSSSIVRPAESAGSATTSSAA